MEMSKHLKADDGQDECVWYGMMSSWLQAGPILCVCVCHPGVETDDSMILSAPDLPVKQQSRGVWPVISLDFWSKYSIMGYFEATSKKSF